MITYEQINKYFVKVEKTFGKVYTNGRTLFSIKRNTFSEMCHQYHG